MKCQICQDELRGQYNYVAINAYTGRPRKEEHYMICEDCARMVSRVICHGLAKTPLNRGYYVPNESYTDIEKRK